jgi:hypothetical protein
VVAELRAPGSVPAAPAGRLDRQMELWLREGRAKLDDAVNPARYPVSPVSLPAGTARRLLDELRGEESFYTPRRAPFFAGYSIRSMQRKCGWSCSELNVSRCRL